MMPVIEQKVVDHDNDDQINEEDEELIDESVEGMETTPTYRLYCSIWSIQC